jgi:creatinine amidohydrolase
VLRWDDLTFTDFRDRVTDRTVAIWPIGILEEHGPHLPLATDAIQAEWGCERLAQREGTILLPPLRYGNGIATAPYPGTISLSFDTVRAVARDVLSELGRQGVRRAMVVSGHLGADHMRALRLAAEETLEERPAMRIAVLSDWEIVYELRGDPGAAGIAADAIPHDDGHAGTLETARMLAIAPHLCRMDRAPPHVPKADIPEFLVTRGLDKHYPSGVLGGDARRATAELGHKVNAHVMRRMEGVLDGLMHGT